MSKIELSEESRYGMFFVIGIAGLILTMVILSYFLGGDDAITVDRKDKEKTVIVSKAKEGTSRQLPSPKAVTGSVRDAIKQGNYSTTYLEISKSPKSSPEYEELKKQLAEETLKRKAPTVRKEAGTSPGTPLRYLDESTPRDRKSDAIYIYFMDYYGAMWPRFCVQVASKRRLGITGFIVQIDNRKYEIPAPSVKFENLEKGVAEWFDEPLNRRDYEVVQAMLKGKKVTLTVIGNGGKSTRDVTEKEIKGFSNIVEGYAALGGNFNYLQESKALSSAPAKKSSAVK